MTKVLGWAHLGPLGPLSLVWDRSAPKWIWGERGCFFSLQLGSSFLGGRVLGCPVLETVVPALVLCFWTSGPQLLSLALSGVGSSVGPGPES